MLLEHQVPDAALLQVVGQRQPGLAGADDDHLVVFRGGAHGGLRSVEGEDLDLRRRRRVKARRTVLDAGQLVLHSGLTERQRLGIDVFEHTWARSSHWAMLATAPDRLPATLDGDRLLAAAVALERVSPAAARRAYTALTERSVLDYGAWFGLGNTAAADGDYSAALVAFEYATTLRPDSADAWNNLALMRLRDGQRDAAVDAARRAVLLGGPRLERYRETLARVQRAPR